MRIGVLALQGAFIEHIQMLNRLGADAFEIRQSADLMQHMDGLIIPGGESTVMAKLMKQLEMANLITDFVKSGLPVLGTCAGMILLSKAVDGASVTTLGLMDTVVRRNAFGRQLGSFQTDAHFAGSDKIPMVFIRAPYLKSVSNSVEILAKIDGKIIAARQNHMLATAFHPELTKDTSVHQYYLQMIEQQQSK